MIRNNSDHFSQVHFDDIPENNLNLLGQVNKHHIRQSLTYTEIK